MPILRVLMLGVLLSLSAGGISVGAKQIASLGSIAGRVLFPSTLTLPPHQEVTLHLMQEGSIVKSLSQALDREGRFRFQNLTPDPQYTYLVSIRLQGVTYHSERLRLTPEQPTIEQVTLQVYEATEDDTPLTITRDHLVIDLFPSHLRVLEVLIVRNGGDKAITSAYFPLPPGFQDFQAAEENPESRVQVDQGGVIPLSPLLPGEKQFVFSYSLPYQGSTISVTKQYRYPTSRVILLLTNPALQVSGDRFVDRGTVEMGERRYRRLDAQNVARNSSLRFTIHSPVGTSVDTTTPASWVIYGAVAFLILCGFLFPLVHRYRPVRMGSTGSSSSHQDGSVQQHPFSEEGREEMSRDGYGRNALIRQIALLDEQYDQKLLDPQEYRKKRRQLKEQLLQVTLQMRDRGDAHGHSGEQ